MIICTPTFKERQLFCVSYKKRVNKHRCVSVGVCEARGALKQMFRAAVQCIKKYINIISIVTKTISVQLKLKQPSQKHGK